jgi:hypothetical protein
MALLLEVPRFERCLFWDQQPGPYVHALVRRWGSVPPLTSVARLMCAHADAITGPHLEPAPQKQLKSQKNTLKTPLEPAKKRWSRTPHLCSPNWSGGTVRWGRFPVLCHVPWTPW